MTAVAQIHIAKKQLGLDEDTYRAKLKALTGKESCKAMTAAEQARVLEAFRRDGFKASVKRPSTARVKKIGALWLSGWNLGVIRDPSSSAMEAFILRQTGIAKAQWLKEAQDAAKVIEALKTWLAREAAVIWPARAGDAGFAVLDAQQRKLARMGIRSSLQGLHSQIAMQRHLGDLIRAAQQTEKQP